MSLDRDQIDPALQPLNRARSMPAGFYTDPAIFAAERERIFQARIDAGETRDRVAQHRQHRIERQRQH